MSFDLITLSFFLLFLGFLLVCIIRMFSASSVWGMRDGR